MPLFPAHLSVLAALVAAISGNSVTSNASPISPAAGSQVRVTASAFPVERSGWALGTDGGEVGIWHTSNAGSAWQIQWQGSGGPLSIVATNRTHAWALIACTGKKPPCGRELLATSDGGARWRVVARLAASVNRVYFGTDRFGVAVADACLTNLALPKCPGRLLVTRDGGARWSTVLSQPAPVSATVSAAGQIWAAETFPGVPGVPGPHAVDLRFLTSTDGGRTWRRLGRVAGLVPLSPDVRVTLATEPARASARLAWAAVSDQLSCSMRGCAVELLTSGTDGMSWTLVNLPDRYPDECGPDGIAFAAATDGSAWAATGRNGAACEPPLGLVYLRAPGKPGWDQLPPWRQDQIGSLTAVSRTVAYAVSGQGALSRTEDGGLHWTQVLPAGLHGVGKMVPVKTERNVVRHSRTTDLGQVGRVENEQERPARLGVENDR